MFKFRKQDRKPEEKREPQPCRDCGMPGVYGVDIFGVKSESWRCRDCHERACASHVRQENQVRFMH